MGEQGHRKFFYGGRLSQNVKKKKKNYTGWLKHPKTVAINQNLDQKIKKNDSKPHIWSSSINVRFSSRKSQSQQN